MLAIWIIFCRRQGARPQSEGACMPFSNFAQILASIIFLIRCRCHGGPNFCLGLIWIAPQHGNLGARLGIFHIDETKSQNFAKEKADRKSVV